MKKLDIYRKVLFISYTIILIPVFLVLIIISYIILFYTDYKVYIPAKFYKHTWLRFNSYLFNSYYKNKYKEDYIKSKIQLCKINCDLGTVNKCIDFINDKLPPHKTYKSDPLKGLIDWIGEPSVQWMRKSLNILEDSFDCDDSAEFLRYLASDIVENVKVVSIVSKKPFLVYSHSFVIINSDDNLIKVFSPWSYLGEVTNNNEVIEMIENCFKSKNIKYFKILI